MLETEKTLLRSPLAEDKQFLLVMRNDVELQGMLMSRAKPNNSSRIDEWIDKRLSDEYGVFFVIADSKTNTPVGYIQLLRMDFIHQRGDLGICIDKHHHGKGYAKDALLLLESYVRNLFNIRKIVLQVLNENLRAIRFYEKMGYRNVGTLQEHFYLNNEFHDVLLMEKKI
jgi:diamine N-acetyltransferase